MAQLKRPFAVRFKHCWSHEPIWETFWTQTSEQAIARAKMLYSDIDSKTEVQIIKIVPLAMNEAIMPPDIRKYNETQEKKPPGSRRLLSDPSSTTLNNRPDPSSA
jgi:hypothetical protein